MCYAQMNISGWVPPRSHHAHPTLNCGRKFALIEVAFLDKIQALQTIFLLCDGNFELLSHVDLRGISFYFLFVFYYQCNHRDYSQNFHILWKRKKANLENFRPDCLFADLIMTWRNQFAIFLVVHRNSSISEQMQCYEIRSTA